MENSWIFFAKDLEILNYDPIFTFIFEMNNLLYAELIISLKPLRKIFYGDNPCDFPSKDYIFIVALSYRNSCYNQMKCILS